ncbi:hypothetical protein [Pseudodonghicola xiamenensis]|uniref:Uncharacterized protein n=1 Tax=Pseudodonghicola xiamenensis TaxID=337702 RepID=A0A8J3MBL4_9RHOB|nr:hypothetical protein [Pseudodonghicola xiamenensis]GHG84330.1 hypothetical protein GCM10010961_10260 [Pseudodonghicola xiamenensis]
MSEKLNELLVRLHEIEEAVQQEVEKGRAEFRYRVDHGRVKFDAEIHRRHRALREGWISFLSRTRFLVVLTAPVIYSLIIPFVILDIFVTLYQAICFPVYGIPKVRRRDHIAIDRQHLAYLNGLQKLNCVYCGYGNGLISFVREVAARTESYWCPIKHARRLSGTHRHYSDFADYGAAETLRQDWEASREKVQKGE